MEVYIFDGRISLLQVLSYNYFTQFLVVSRLQLFAFFAYQDEQLVDSRLYFGHQKRWQINLIDLQYLTRFQMQSEFPGTLQNILDQKTLKWIFVGGKGGVGKTTTSSSLATLLSKQNRKTLIISTDPAHNLSDCFDQKVTKDPTPIEGIPNLFAMEIDPKVKVQSLGDSILDLGNDEGTRSLMSQIISSVPGIDEAMSFGQLINTIQKMDFEIIVFDTAPTGHTLRFLNFPNILEKGLSKLLTLKEKFNTLLQSMGSVFGSPEELNKTMDSLFGKMQKMKENSKTVNDHMKDPTKTTFIAVCIPEFLSMYETQRLIQELAKYNIDIHNIVINQILFPDDQCKMCKSRSKMQKKYLDQIIELYDDFHIVIMPLQEEEVRGTEKLSNFCQLLLQDKSLPK